MRVTMMWVAIAALLLGGQSAVAADVYKCRDAKGKVSYSDKPCPDDAHSEAPRKADRAPSVAGIRALCDDAGLGWVMDRDSINELQAGLPSAQIEALRAMTLAVANARDDPPPRWYRSRRDDIHVCLTGLNGRDVELVAGINGEVVEFRNGRGTWINDPGTPMARLEQCTEVITSCVERTPKAIDRCVYETQACGSAPSEGCCPSECGQAYRARRDAGIAPISAFQQVFFGTSSCVPGLNDTGQRLEVIPG